VALAGGALIYRGATGYCPMYGAAGISTAHEGVDTREALGGRRGINVEKAVTIDKPVEELYRFWRNFENLPRFMSHVESVKPLDGNRSHWVVKGPAGSRVEWDAEIINEVPNKVIAWKTLRGADVISAGSVNFDPQPDGRGTSVRVRLQYEPPAGKLGAAVAWLFGEEPAQQITEDLRRLKQLLEAREVPTTEGQPVGGRR
jgi:uncharacterized membrane protein